MSEKNIHKGCGSMSTQLIVRVFIVIIFLAVLYHLKTGWINIRNTASHVEGFELKYNGFKPKVFPFFHTEYAVWANYPYFTHDGDTYEQVGMGGVIVHKNKLLPTKYLVEETARIQNTKPYPRIKLSTLRVVNKSTGDVMASRIIRDGQVENDVGWEGEHAAKFIRKVLLTDKPIGGHVGVKPYPKLSLKKQEQIIQKIDIKNASEKMICPKSFKISKSPWPATLDTHHWKFKPQAPIDSFSCSNGYVLVSSYVYPETLYFDLLTIDGRFVQQFEINILVPVGVTEIKLESFAMLGRNMQIYFHHKSKKNEAVNSSTYTRLTVAIR